MISRPLSLSGLRVSLSGLRVSLSDLRVSLSSLLRISLSGLRASLSSLRVSPSSLRVSPSSLRVLLSDRRVSLVSLCVMLGSSSPPLTCFAEPPRASTSCQARWTATLKRHERRLMYAQHSLKSRFAQARTKLWLPKSPQLRGRLDYEFEDPSSRGRVGLRWHLPRLSMGDPPPEILRQLGLSEESLPERWLALKRHELWIEVLRGDLQLREAEMTRAVLSYEERLSQAELTLRSQLLREGLTTLISVQTLKSKHRSLQLELRRATRELKRLMIMVNGSTPLLEGRDARRRESSMMSDPLELPTGTAKSVMNCLSPETFTALQGSLSDDRERHSRPPLSLGETELIIQQNMSRFKAQSNAHQ